jgi:hypothetical protein
MATTSSHPIRGAAPTWSGLRTKSSQDAPLERRLPAQPTASRFTDAEWMTLVREDNVALSSISILLASIIGLGALGMGIVVAILAFGG